MTHRLLIEAPLPPEGAVLEVLGAEAHHAIRVKRLTEGEVLAVGDGQGAEGEARVAAVEKRARGEWALVLSVERRWSVPRVCPQVRVFSGVPKGPRLEALVDQLSQAGAASWAPLIAERSVVDPRPGKLERMRRVSVEAAKQCWRPWLLEIGEVCRFADALQEPESRLVIADPSGERYSPDASARITLLIGPEGGWSDRELGRAREAGAQAMSIGPHVMRVENAAPIATALILDAERARSGLGRWNKEHVPCEPC